MTEDARQYSPSTARNRDPIWSVLQRHLPVQGLVLECLLRLLSIGDVLHLVDHVARSATVVSHPSDTDMPPEPGTTRFAKTAAAAFAAQDNSPVRLEQESGSAALGAGRPYPATSVESLSGLSQQGPAGNLRTGETRDVKVDLTSALLPAPRLTPDASGVVWVDAYTDFKLHDICEPGTSSSARVRTCQPPWWEKFFILRRAARSGSR